jgi:hypothetical protein
MELDSKWPLYSEKCLPGAIQWLYPDCKLSCSLELLRRTEAPLLSFFGWLILHKRILTAENLLIRHWPCDWICSLCREDFEDTTHLAKDCEFTELVWNQVCNWQELHLPPPSNSQSISDWIEGLSVNRSKRERKIIMGALLTTWWHIWLERNRRIFHQRSLPPIQVAYSIMENIDLL